MTNDEQWTYYRYGLLYPGEPSPTYMRYRHGLADVLSTERRVWVPTDGIPISRYIENGETTLNDISRKTMESEVGFPLPD